MSWFLVLLFWNPAIQNFDVADGWYPMEYPTETVCEMREDFLRLYLDDVILDTDKWIVDCIQAEDMWFAVEELKETL